MITFPNEIKEKRKKFNWFLLGFTFSVLIFGVVAFVSLDREDFNYSDLNKKDILGLVLPQQEISGCNPTGDDCSATCEDFFISYSAEGSWAQSGGKCYDDGAMMFSAEVHNDTTVNCDTHCGAGTGECAIFDDMMMMDTYCCPSYERNGDSAVDEGDCSCTDGGGSCLTNVTTLFNLSYGFFSEGDVPPDTEYPQFSNYWDNNASLVGSGTGLFNVTLLSTNGTVLLDINGSNFTASNSAGDVYNFSVTIATGVYPYRWHSWGNGTSANYNSSIELSYTVNATPPVISRTLKGIKNSTGDVIWRIYDNGSIWTTS